MSAPLVDWEMGQDDGECGWREVSSSKGILERRSPRSVMAPSGVVGRKG